VATSNYNYNSQAQIFWRGDPQPAHDPYSLYTSTGNIGIRRDVAAGATSNILTYPTSGINSNFHHFVVTYDSVAGTMSVYLDAALVAQQSFSTNNIAYATNTFYNMIGAVDYSSPWQFFFGKIDDIGVWNRVLMPCEITGLYQAQLICGDTTHLTSDSTICAQNTPFTLTAPGGYNSYIWNNGSTNSSISITNSGQYWVTATSPCMIYQDTFNITVHPVDTIHNYTVTDACNTGLPFTLNAPSGYAPYLWSNGSNTSFTTVSDTGVYWVSGSGNCTILADTFKISYLHSDTILKHTDTALCISAMPIQLNAPGGYTSYAWNTGDITANISVNYPGDFWYTATKVCQVVADTYHVAINLPDTGYFSIDTNVCSSAMPITLNLPEGYTFYVWSMGENTSSVSVNTLGIYQALAVNYSNCTALSDTFHISATSLNIPTHNDTSACGDLVLHVPINNATYLWADGSTSQSLTVYSSGVYNVLVNANGCSVEDTFDVNIVRLQENIHDSVICIDEPVNVIVNSNAPAEATILWSTGSTYSSISITDTGKYWVLITDGKCSVNDTFYYAGEQCNCQAYIPGAFTPNNDNKNETIKPLFRAGCNVSEYSFSIFNRWGQVVFHSLNPSDSWNGNFNGIYTEIGTYKYELKYTAGLQHKAYFYKGDITLVR
jgi:gliding motility-associated-like protein